MQCGEHDPEHRPFVLAVGDLAARERQQDWRLVVRLSVSAARPKPLLALVVHNLPGNQRVIVAALERQNDAAAFTRRFGTPEAPAEMLPFG